MAGTGLGVSFLGLIRLFTHLGGKNQNSNFGFSSFHLLFYVKYSEEEEGAIVWERKVHTQTSSAAGANWLIRGTWPTAEMDPRAPDETNQVTMAINWSGVFMWQRAPRSLKQIKVSLAPANSSASAHISGETFGWTGLVSETQISDLKFRASPRWRCRPRLL